MSNILKIYIGLFFTIFVATLTYSWTGIKVDEILIMLGLAILIILFNIDTIKDLQSNNLYFIFRPFTIPAIVYLDTFYLMILVAIVLTVKLFKQPWYKKGFNISAIGFSKFISSSIFLYFYPNVTADIIFSQKFLIILLTVVLLDIFLDNLFVFIVASLEKGSFNVNSFITLSSTVKTSLLTLFLGLINVILFYYTNLIGVAVFTFLVYFIKPALQYREIFDNELSTYTNFVLHILKQMDPITHSHSERVKFWTVLLAKKMGLPSTEIRQLSQAASWHDIGKIEIDLEILNKPGRLVPEEYDLIKEHPEQGYQLVKDMHFFKKFLPVIRHHHERYDGTGYPMGLKGESIPLHARIMAITDAFDAMTSDRSYRTGMEMADAVEELLRHSGPQFDPKLVNIFIQALKDEYGENYEHFYKEIIMDVG